MINAINKQGPKNDDTALHDTIWQENIEIAKLLPAADADLNLLLNEGKLPLDFARSRKRKEIEALIFSKSDKSLRYQGQRCIRKVRKNF